ncbi:MAG TPA: hypothetical protein VEC37_08165 [Bacillota bacterium]|nr:hypothetical protein [Bacillota bacterium]
MSFSCTLHPVDPRVIRELRQGIKAEREDWSFLLRLWRQKQLINRVNQPFKHCLQELFTGHPEFRVALYLWGRPFFLQSDDPNRINQGIASLYGMNKETEIFDFFLAELTRLTGDSPTKQLSIKFQRHKEPDLGINQVMERLRLAYKNRSYQELGMDLGFVLAQLVGVAYPYWHLGSYGLSFLEELRIPGWENQPAGLQAHFSEFEAFVPYIPQNLERNLSAGIYLDPEEVRELAALIAAEEPVILYRMAQKQLALDSARLLLQKTREALAYAEEYRFGLMEASDIYERKPPPFP